MMIRNVLSSIIAFVFGLLLMLALVFSGFIPVVDEPEKNLEWGSFPARPQVELLPDGRNLELLADFGYQDPRGRLWTATKGSIVNGASIPEVFWPIVGTPLIGKYRDASIVHDEACVRKSEDYRDVHRMFYEACRCSGVPDHQAKLLYAAVYHFGPAWEKRPVMEVRESEGPDGDLVSTTVTRMVPESLPISPPPQSSVVDKLKSLIDSKNPSLEEIQSLDVTSLQ